MTKQRFGRNKFTLALVHGAAATTVSTTTALNGLLRQVIVKAPAAVDAGATLTINIIDSDLTTIYTKATIAANTTSNNLLTMDLSVPLSGAQRIEIVFTAAQTVTDTSTVVTLLTDRG
jgi:hypothetical protein